MKKATILLTKYNYKNVRVAKLKKRQWEGCASFLPDQEYVEQSSQELNADHLLQRILRILLMCLDLITNKFEGLFHKGTYVVGKYSERSRCNMI